MKSVWVASLCILVSITGARGQLPWFDTMTNYPVGNITTNAGSLWIRHSGGNGDSLVVDYAGSPTALAGHRYEVNQARADDVRRLFSPDTNGVNSGVVYASFIVSVTNLPGNPGGTYFAHFSDVNNNTIPMFRGRIFAIVPPNPYPYTNAAAGTFRFGVANAAGDYPNAGGGPAAVVPLDLALNTDYQVVLACDIANATSTLWVNPTSEGDAAASSGAAFDMGPYTNALAAFAFRQSSGEGVLEIRNVAVGQSFADVMTNTAALAAIGLQPANVTNFAGNPAFLEVAASGMGLSYQWMKGTTEIPGATGQLLLFDSLSAGDSGSYYCTVRNSAGSTNSQSAYISVDATPTAPTFTIQPLATTISVGESFTLTAAATGTGPLNYQWKCNGVIVVDGTSTLPGDTSVTTGAQSPILKITSVSTNEAGVYTVQVVGAAGNATSSPAQVTVTPPRPVTIAYLRSLLDTSTMQPKDKTTLFNITGVIVSYTNTTTGNTASYYIQDDTAGINLFVSGTGAASFRPQLGDQVTANGTLLTYTSNLELQCLVSNPYQSYTILSHNNVLPAPKVIPFTITNSVATTELINNSLVMFTNVYFMSNSIATGNRNMMATNSAGTLFLFYFPASQDQDLRNRTLPSFAWTVTGVLVRYNSIYECMVTRFVDVVGTAPTAGALQIAKTANKNVLSWTAVPFGYVGGGYAYSLLGATDLTGPWTPVAMGLSFTNAAGAFEDPATEGRKFYRLVSP